jgi:hypothetical protein
MSLDVYSHVTPPDELSAERLMQFVNGDDRSMPDGGNRK